MCFYERFFDRPTSNETIVTYYAATDEESEPCEDSHGRMQEYHLPLLKKKFTSTFNVHISQTLMSDSRYNLNLNLKIEDLFTVNSRNLPQFNRAEILRSFPLRVYFPASNLGFDLTGTPLSE